MNKLVKKSTAQLLKDAGFAQKVCNYYHPSYGLMKNSSKDNYNSKKWADGYISAPTLHEATDWLREKGLHVYAFPSEDWSRWHYKIHDKHTLRCSTFIGIPNTGFSNDEALSIGITRALELLKSKL